MKLLTNALKQRFEQIGSQDGKGLDAIVVVRFFDPCGSWTWYATEFDAVDGIFFGFVDGSFPEWGSFSLGEFLEFNIQAKRNMRRLGLGIERDIHCGERTLREHLRVTNRDELLRQLESS